MKEYIQNILEAFLKNECQLFDVREKKEWKKGVIKGAFLQPISLLKNGLLNQEADKQKKTYLYCAGGVRVFPAAELLKAMGFDDPIPLKEGFLELKSLGFQVQ